MKAFKVFWKGSINGDDEEYVSSAVIVAESFGAAMKIAESYGNISALHSESDHVIITLKEAAGPGFVPNPVAEMVKEHHGA
jgi:hypothetical protein